MGRITRHPPKIRLKYLFEVRVRHDEREQPWIWEQAARIGGLVSYKKRRAGWPSTLISFDTQEKAHQLQEMLERWRHERDLAELARRPCPITEKYERAALGQYAVVWGLSSGIIQDVVQAYRSARRRCSTHGPANYEAARVIVARCPHLDTYAGCDRARDMVDHMLVYVEPRRRDWFWKGLEGDHTLYPFRFYK